MKWVGLEQGYGFVARGQQATLPILVTTPRKGFSVSSGPVVVQSPTEIRFHCRSIQTTERPSSFELLDRSNRQISMVTERQRVTQEQSLSSNSMKFGPAWG